MGRSELFDHTADVGIRICAESLDDLFATAAAALFRLIVVNHEVVREEVAETIELEAESLSQLLVDWLNELIFRTETQHRVYHGFEVQVDGQRPALRAVIRGEPIDPQRHILDHEVKAATRHGAGVSRGNGGFTAEIILDI